ncbi:MAG: GAF domain-containing protein, partial [bacterium]|nr:GAF domain-containing protein [bacterium]
LSKEIAIKQQDEIGVLADSFNNMLHSLQEAAEESTKINWLKNGQTELADQLRGGKDIHTMAKDVIVCVARHLDAQVGTLYVQSNDNMLRLTGTYSFSKRKNLVTEIEPGQGLVGQVALEKNHILIEEVPEEYLRVGSSLGSAVVKNILAMPLLKQNEVKGVMELGSFKEFTDLGIEFLKMVSESIAIAINSTQENEKTLSLLQQTQTQAEEMQVQQEELRESNERLQA